MMVRIDRKKFVSILSYPIFRRGIAFRNVREFLFQKLVDFPSIIEIPRRDANVISDDALIIRTSSLSRIRKNLV